MDKLLPYLLLFLVVIASWNETLNNRFRRLWGEESRVWEDDQTHQRVAVSKSTPFWQEPGYKTPLEKAEENLQKRQKSQSKPRELIP